MSEFVKENVPNITEIHNFSDGCAAKFKNRFNFMNIYLYENDFMLKAEWSFFATSHGKTEYGGIGENVKRLLQKVSLQRPLQNQIQTPHYFFQFCKLNIKKVIFHFILKDSVYLICSKLEESFQDLIKFSGTRSFHNFGPKNCSGTLEARRIKISKIISFGTQVNNQGQLYTMLC